MTPNIHLLGICGTFMSGIAKLAKEIGYNVSGSDSAFYAPIGPYLHSLNLNLHVGWNPGLIDALPEYTQYIVGNCVSRGNPFVEELMRRNHRLYSGPEWVYEEILSKRTVLAVAGTHGKTTTASLLTWILNYNDKNPGFLIGGIPNNFECNARYTDSTYFIIEADEYDTAFFDKRAKFIHYRPYVAILNNLEFDHADIYEDIRSIQKSFHHFIRTIPPHGKIIFHADQIHDAALADTVKQGCWTPTITFGPDGLFHTKPILNSTGFQVCASDDMLIEVSSFALLGSHNQSNALAAMLAANAIGISLEKSAQALTSFKGVKRRLELKKHIGHIFVYDDFAHHPTAISAGLNALQTQHPNKNILLILELASNTMRQGFWQEELDRILPQAYHWYILGNEHYSLKELELSLAAEFDHEKSSIIVVMSNKDSERIHQMIDRILLLKGIDIR